MYCIQFRRTQTDIACHWTTGDVIDSEISIAGCCDYRREHQRLLPINEDKLFTIECQIDLIATSTRANSQSIDNARACANNRDCRNTRVSYINMKS